MAEPVWTTPVNWTGGSVPLDTDLDAQLSQNAVYLYGPRGQHPTEVTVQQTSEVTILSHTVNASDLGTNRMLRASFLGYIVNDSSNTHDLRLRIKFGGTTLYDDTEPYTPHGPHSPFRLKCWMGMCNSASVQFLVCTITSGSPPGGAIDSVYQMNGTFGTAGTAGIVTTSDRDFVVTVQPGATNTFETLRIRKQYALVELI